MYLGIAHHFGWAVAVTATPDHEVMDRRRIDLIAPNLSPAPIHYDAGKLDDHALTALVAEVRASAAAVTSAALDALVDDLPRPIVSISLRTWPADFPEDVVTLRRAPYESRADSVMYLRVLAEVATARDWHVHLYDARSVERDATAVLGDRSHQILQGPRTVLGPPWTKDHRTALAATVLAGHS